MGGNVPEGTEISLDEISALFLGKIFRHCSETQRREEGRYLCQCELFHQGSGRRR